MWTFLKQIILALQEDEDIKCEEHLRLISDVLTEGWEADSWEVQLYLLEFKKNPDVNDIMSEHKGKPSQQRYHYAEYGVSFMNAVLYRHTLFADMLL